MTINLFIRTGHRVLFHLRDFSADDPEGLYREIKRIEWEEYLFEDGYLTITSTVDNPCIRDTRFANLKCKDAIVDRMKERRGRRPDSGPDRGEAVIHLHWKDNRCSIFLDTSGEPLSRRNYRKIPLKAPMQETLAAAVVMATGWQGRGNFINPMCGSGTLSIEAALIGASRAPGLLRDNFGFMHLKGFNRKAWQVMRKEAEEASRPLADGRIVATDISSEAVGAARTNAAAAGVAHLMEFRVCDFRETPVPEGGGIVLLNPEYGERLGKQKDLTEIYKGIGDFFKHQCRGYKGYVFTGNLPMAKTVGLRTKSRIPFFNSNIECRLLEYEIYEGTRKIPKPFSS
jgi:putative N6-adenine-specific DNA methylase